MTFLNPLVLFGLAAAGIPILLHLLNLRKLRTVEFSTLSFLKELQQTKIRRLKLRQWLLLLLRTLLVIAIIVAFARPVLRGTMLGQIGAHAHSTVVFILDDSFSMLGTDERGDRFKQAKDVAAQLVSLLKDGDEAFLIRLSDLPKATIDPATHDFAALLDVLKESQSSKIRRPLDEAYKTAARLLAASKNANKEVYLVSDIQRTLFPENLKPAPPPVALFPEGMQFFLVPVGSKNIANAAVDSIEIGTSIIEKDKPVSLTCTIRNYGTAALRDYVVSVFLDGIRAAQSNVNVEPWGSAQASFSISPKRTGHIAGRVELEQDAIDEDNRRYFTLYVPEVISLALIGSTPSETQYPLLALNAGAAEHASLLSITQTSPQKLSLLNLGNIDLVMSATWDGFTVADADRIAAFVRQGGGLILFPGTNATVSGSSLISALHLPAVTGVSGGSAEPTGLYFQNVDLDHPIFSSMFDNDRSHGKQPSAPEAPAILKSLQFRPGKEGHSIITLSGGGSFLSEQKLGEGKILLFSVAPLLSWSDFPLKGLFAPLIHRAVMYASAHEESNPTFLTGEEPLISVPQRHPGSGPGKESSPDRLLTLVAPDKVEEVLHQMNQVATHGEITVKTTSLTQTGIYTIAASKDPLTIFAVNSDRRESDTRTATTEDLSLFWKSLGIPENAVHSAAPSESLPAAILQSRFGVELWQYLVALAILLALIEMLVARDSRKETVTA